MKSSLNYNRMLDRTMSATAQLWISRTRRHQNGQHNGSRLLPGGNAERSDSRPHCRCIRSGVERQTRRRHSHLLDYGFRTYRAEVIAWKAKS